MSDPLIVIVFFSSPDTENEERTNTNKTISLKPIFFIYLIFLLKYFWIVNENRYERISQILQS
ncbi:hypothetical protein LEP1GSC192_1116 [Leptospira sp. B5-022]|nr:hypothetical protein LEP1GSC192_1116 [Leptospira sp. B5-022]